MMFNVRFPAGRRHAVGGATRHPARAHAACLSLTIALAIQAFLFGDGGILAFGANALNIAIIRPFAGYYVYAALRKLLRFETGSAKDLFAVGLAAYVGINLAALATGFQFGIQPLLFHTPEGQALYCPYPLSVALPAMAIGHLTIFGLAEIIFSVGVYAFICKTAPSFATNAAFFAQPGDGETDDDSTDADSKPRPKFGALYLALAVLIALTPLGLLAQGDAWGEWGAEDIAAVTTNGEELGYTPQAMIDGFQWQGFIPDYSAPGAPEWLSYVLSAIAGARVRRSFQTRDASRADQPAQE